MNKIEKTNKMLIAKNCDYNIVTLNGVEGILITEAYPGIKNNKYEILPLDILAMEDFEIKEYVLDEIINKRGQKRYKRRFI